MRQPRPDPVLLDAALERLRSAFESVPARHPRGHPPELRPTPLARRALTDALTDVRGGTRSPHQELSRPIEHDASPGATARQPDPADADDPADLDPDHADLADDAEDSPTRRPQRSDPLPGLRVRLGGRQAAVIVAVLLVGLGITGWALLRSRPVALALDTASPVSTAPAGDPATEGGSSGPGVPRRDSAGAESSAPAGGAAQSSPGSGHAATDRELVVHVIGAVRKPGLVELGVGARVQDAIDAAGGLRRSADPGQLNLAQPVADGEQVVIGTRHRPVGEVRSSGAANRQPAAGPGAGTGSDSPVVDLNVATQPQLEELPGVGPVTAAAILGWRDQHGRFTRVDELQEVDGIGPKTFARIAPHVRV